MKKGEKRRWPGERGWRDPACQGGSEGLLVRKADD